MVRLRKPMSCPAGPWSRRKTFEISRLLAINRKWKNLLYGNDLHHRLILVDKTSPCASRLYLNVISSCCRCAVIEGCTTFRFRAVTARILRPPLEKPKKRLQFSVGCLVVGTVDLCALLVLKRSDARRIDGFRAERRATPPELARRRRVAAQAEPAGRRDPGGAAARHEDSEDDGPALLPGPRRGVPAHLPHAVEPDRQGRSGRVYINASEAVHCSLIGSYYQSLRKILHSWVWFWRMNFTF